MTRYSVFGHVAGLGPVNHVIKAPSQDAAWQRFEAAHGAANCHFLKIEKAWLK